MPFLLPCMGSLERNLRPDSSRVSGGQNEGFHIRILATTGITRVGGRRTCETSCMVVGRGIVLNDFFRYDFRLAWARASAIRGWISLVVLFSFFLRWGRAFAAQTGSVASFCRKAIEPLEIQL